MRRRDNTLPVLLHQVAHTVLLIAAFYAAMYTKINLPPGLGGLDNDYLYYRLDLVLLIITCHFSLRFFGFYRQRRAISVLKTLCLSAQVVYVGIAGMLFFDYFLHHWGESRLLLVIFSCYFVLFLTSFEYLFLRFRAGYLKSHKRNILIIGSRHRVVDFIRQTERRSARCGYQVVGCLELPAMAETVGDRVYEAVKIIGTIDALETILKTKPIDELVFGIPLKKVADIGEYIFLAEQMGINIHILPDFQIRSIRYYPKTANLQLDDFLGVPIMTLSSLPRKTVQLFIKSIFDYISAAAGLLILWPLLALIAIAIKLTSPGGVFFSQERCGLNGRIFKMYKFRSMVAGAENLKTTLDEQNEMDGPVFKMKNDPRITPVGRFLRATSLDELPQLFNVLKGDMSLVGPRPPIPAEVGQYKLWQRRRLSMKPGLTCIWQVSGRNNTSFERWMEMDLRYIDNWSLKLDLILLLKTIREITVGGGR